MACRVAARAPPTRTSSLAASRMTSLGCSVRRPMLADIRPHDLISRRTGQMNRGTMNDNAAVVLATIRAVEQRDGETLLGLCDPEAEFIWPSSLPYGGKSLQGLLENGPAYAAAWDDFQTDAERQMNPHVIATTDDE